MSLYADFPMTENKKTIPTLGESLLPVLFLIFLLTGSVYLFADDSSSGPNQIALILSAGLTCLIGAKNGFHWSKMQSAMAESIARVAGALFILLAVGCLISTWMMAGIIPTMIYYGLQLMNPDYFFCVAVVVCAITSLAIGSSWTTVSTVGIALISIATALNLHLGLAAGAIISGAYFGDKMSPLSDTTNLAPAIVGIDLFTHIRHMMYTTLPSFILSLILFFIIGLNSTPSVQTAELSQIINALTEYYDMGWHFLLPLVLVIAMVIKKVPAFPAILMGALIGGIFAIIFQPQIVLSYASYDGKSATFIYLLKGVWMALYSEFYLNTNNEVLNSLVSRGGMRSMLTTVWLIISAMMFGGALEKIGALKRLSSEILKKVKSTGSLIFATLMTALGMNFIASDQYMSIVFPGRMYCDEFKQRNLHPKNLSRAIEDAGTLTSPLVPWNTCGAFMAGSLGIATLDYLPFCFFNLLNFLVSATYGFVGLTIDKLGVDEVSEK